MRRSRRSIGAVVGRSIELELSFQKCLCVVS